MVMHAFNTSILGDRGKSITNSSPVFETQQFNKNLSYKTKFKKGWDVTQSCIQLLVLQYKTKYKQKKQDETRHCPYLEMTQKYDY